MTYNSIVFCLITLFSCSSASAETEACQNYIATADHIYCLQSRGQYVPQVTRGKAPATPMHVVSPPKGIDEGELMYLDTPEQRQESHQGVLDEAPASQ